MDHPAACDLVNGHEEALVQMRRVRGHCVDLGRGVARPDVSLRGVSACLQIHRQHAADMPSQLALNSQQRRIQVEHEVISSSLTQGAKHHEAKLDRRRRDRSLGPAPF
jgi:hypothetical protein